MFIFQSSRRDVDTVGLIARFREQGRVACLGCLLLTLAPVVALADDEDPVTSGLRSAWVKFSELHEVSESHGRRGEIALEQLQLDHRKAGLLGTIRTMNIEVDSWRVPRNRWTSPQVEYWEELLGYKQQVNEIDNRLTQLNLLWREENEAAIRRAEAAGKTVKPLDRPGLLREMQRQNREAFDAFATAKKAIEESAGQPGMTRLGIYKQAMTELGRAPADAPNLVPLKPFRLAFEEYCGKSFFTQGKKPKRGKADRRITWSSEARPSDRPA